MLNIFLHGNGLSLQYSKLRGILPETPGFFSLQFHCGCLLRLHAGLFSPQVSCGVFFAFARRLFFFLILCNSLFWGGRDTSTSEAGFSPSPEPLLLFQHMGFTAASFEHSPKLDSLRSGRKTAKQARNLFFRGGFASLPSPSLHSSTVGLQ